MKRAGRILSFSTYGAPGLIARLRNAELPELGTTVGALGDRIVSANAYIGAEPIVDCLREDAQIVLGGRLADPSLFVGPICHELGWSLDDHTEILPPARFVEVFEIERLSVTPAVFDRPSATDIVFSPVRRYASWIRESSSTS